MSRVCQKQHVSYFMSNFLNLSEGAFIKGFPIKHTNCRNIKVTPPVKVKIFHIQVDKLKSPVEPVRTMTVEISTRASIEFSNLFDRMPTCCQLEGYSKKSFHDMKKLLAHCLTFS